MGKNALPLGVKMSLKEAWVSRDEEYIKADSDAILLYFWCGFKVVLISTCSVTLLLDYEVCSFY